MVCRCLFLILLCGLTGNCAQIPCSLITSSVLRLDSEETIIVDGHNSAFDADIIIQDFPHRTHTLVQGQVVVDKDNGFLGTTTLSIPANNLEINPKKKQFVYVTVTSTSCNLEKVILVTIESGHIFIQTDKPIYTPGSKGLYRIFAMNPTLQPVNKPVIIKILSPENVIIYESVQPSTNTGIASRQFSLPELASFGVWTISAKFMDKSQIYTTNFEVKEYVLSRFEVKIEPMQRFFLINDQELRIHIYANYVFGKPVNGKAFVLFGLKRDNEKKILTDTLRRISISNGEATATLESKDLVKYFKIKEDMLNWRLYVTVTVITDSGSDLVEAESDDIHIVTSPYKILFTKSSTFFKPGLPFELMVFVTKADGTPAVGVPVMAEPGAVTAVTQADGTVWLNFNTKTDINSLVIQVTTTDYKLTNDQQASATIVTSAYRSTGGNYLHISHINKGVLKPGDNTAINFIAENRNSSVGNQIRQINYVLLNKGRIMSLGRLERSPGQTLVSKWLPISAEFIPSFRIVAYYVVTTGAQSEIVADSVWIDVADTCMGTLQVTAAKDKDNAIQEPGSSVTLKLRADHKATVGLVAVDKAVYVHSSKYKISQKKVWDSVEKYDLGCTPGSGADAPGVFYDAGLALHTNFQVTTPQKSEPLCEATLKRRRRSAADYEDEDYIDDSDIITRTEFLESWLWMMATMDGAPDGEGISTKDLRLFLKDVITTWEVLAVSLSESKGICVSQPHEIKVLMSFFLDLKLPYSVVRYEQVEIRAILYNYGNKNLKVRVLWTYNDQLCSLSTAKKKYRQEIIIEPQSSVVVPFIIVPLTLGDHDVEVKATTPFFIDGVKKVLKVVPEGRYFTKVLKSVVLDPQVKGRAGIQEELISVLDEKIIVPKTDIFTHITLKGNVDSETLGESINAVNLSDLISAPLGNGEQNMRTMTPPVIVGYYLETTAQWNRVGVHLREEALRYIQDGITKQLVYRKSDSSYAALITNPSSTWLTAFVVKVFALAGRLVKVEDNVLCNPVKWLIQEKQKDGLFQENNPVAQQEMVGGITMDADELDSTLTAFVLIAILESEQTCGPHVDNLLESINRATTFLNGRYPSLENPYSIAITSYALARAGKLRDTKKLMSASTDNTHWGKSGSDPLSLEATSYALLTLLKTRQFEKARSVVRWLTEQRFYGSPNGATQATIMVYQALAQYQINVPPVKDLNMVVAFKLPGNPQHKHYRITHHNTMVAFSVKIERGEFTVAAKGKGQVTLTVSSLFYAFETEKEKKCNNFDLSVTIKDEPLAMGPDGTISTVSITICMRSLKAQDAPMSILDISMMTGFSPDIEDIKKLKNNPRYMIDNERYEGTLLLYIDKISHTEEECVKLNLHQFYKVGLIQPASVTVYEYYSPEDRCTKFYHVDEGSNSLGRICKGEVCRCAEENCFIQKQLNDIDATARLSKACDMAVDYVFKTELTATEHKDNYDTYVMTIIEVFKKGTEGDVSGKTRNFISQKRCQQSLQLQTGREYLVWGVGKDVWNTGSELIYIISKDTWIENWPNNRECQKDENEKLCTEINFFSEELKLFGCAL